MSLSTMTPTRARETLYNWIEILSISYGVTSVGIIRPPVNGFRIQACSLAQGPKDHLY